MVRSDGADERRGRSLTGVAAPSAFMTLLLAAGALAATGEGVLRAETLGGALVKTYLNNPDINTQRAAVRVADENVPKANAGYLPTITAEGDAGVQHTNSNAILLGAGQSQEFNFATGTLPRGYGITGTET